MFLHPSDILALALRKAQKVCRTSEVAHISEVLFSKTCKAPQRSTRQNEVWVVALHRVCLENAFYLPSFPISTWVTWNLKSLRWPCVDGLNSDAFEKQHINDPGAILRPRTTRVIKGSFATGINYNSSSCQVGDTCWVFRVIVYLFWIWAIHRVPIASYWSGRRIWHLQSSGHSRWHGLDKFFV